MGKHARIAARVAGRGHEGGFHPCYLEYFRLFNAQEYYEAHDVLEHIWLDAEGERYIFYKALIQFAGGHVHLRHHFREPSHRIHGQRLRPAARLFRRSAELLTDLPPTCEGLTLRDVIAMALSTADSLESASFTANPWHPSRAPVLQPPTFSNLKSPI
jgi:predicted metal-dependent hydrolase